MSLKFEPSSETLLNYEVRAQSAFCIDFRAEAVFLSSNQITLHQRLIRFEITVNFWRCFC